MSKAVVISGYLHNISDNIIPFIEGNDVYCHTWNDNDNMRWVGKLKRYEKYSNSISIDIEAPKYKKKTFSYFYSTWYAVNMIKDIDKYEYVIKFKPNIDTDVIPYKDNFKSYFNKAYYQSQPLLNGVKYDECFYGSIYYHTMDERIFFGYPLAFKKVFHILYKHLHTDMLRLHDYLTLRYGKIYEGSLFWKEFLENKGVECIQNPDLKIVNNIQ